jgi:hypothetical protein
MRIKGTGKHGFVQGVTGNDRGEGKEIVGFILMASQVISLATAVLPMVRVVFEGVRKSLGFVFKRGRLEVMDTYKGKNCRVRTLAYAVTDSIINLLQDKPGGYSFFAALPSRGRNNADALRKKIADTLLSGFYNSSFMSILLRSALDDNGKPTQGPLYQWLLTHVYSEDVRRMYKDWLKACNGEVIEGDE